MTLRRSRRFIATLVVAVCAVAASCSTSSQPAAPPPNPLAVPTSDPTEITLPTPTTADLMADALRADAVVAARVVWIGPAPGRPGNPCAVQGVTYRVVDVLRGSVPEAEIRVAHPVCMGRPFVDNKTVGLSKAYFEPDRPYILFLERDPSGRVRYDRDDGPWTSDYAVWGERVGTLPDDGAIREQVRKAVAAAGGSKPSTGDDPFTHSRRR
jgi:hypothetical protein